MSNYATTSQLNSVILTATHNISIDYIACVNNINFTNVGTYPNYTYALQMSSLYSSYCMDVTGITGPSEYFLYLPTNFVNGQFIYVHCTFSRSYGMGKTSTNIITWGSNQQFGLKILKFQGMLPNFAPKEHLRPTGMMFVRTCVRAYVRACVRHAGKYCSLHISR